MRGKGTGRRVRGGGALMACLAMLLVVAGDAAPAAAAKKAKCPRGTVPALTGSAKKAKVVRSRSGKLRCRRPAKPKASGIPKPSASPQSQIASTADQFAQALAVNPDAFSKISRAIGSRRTKALTGLALRAWRQKAGAARARASDGDGGLHVNETFGVGTGASATIKLDAAEVTAGGKLGLQASATVDIDVTAEGLKDLAPGALGDATSAKAKLEMTFNDVPAACPTAAGKVAGKLLGKAKVTLTTQGSGGAVSQFASADIQVGYSLTVGENARWQTIDDVDAQTAFAYGGSGQGTETWRGRRLGGGFDEKGIFGKGKSESTVAQQYAHFDQTKGGIFGPHGSVHFETGPTAWDIRSISNLKGLIVTSIATDYLTLAAMEYVRGVVVPRLEKHWYDDEACLRLDASAAAAKIAPGGTTKVTARNAKAADGGTVPASLTASGAQSLTPASGQLAKGGSKEFTLTAPSSKPVNATWKIVALSRAGKKTVTGSLNDRDRYTVTLSSAETGTFATHDATATLSGVLVTAPQAGSNPQTWTASGPVTWSDIVFTPKIDCTFVNPISGGTWSVTITAQPADTIQVAWGADAATLVLATIVCPDAAIVDGEPGPRPVGVEPTTFVLPAAGGTQRLSGSVTLGSDGFRRDGTIVVEPASG